MTQMRQINTDFIRCIPANTRDLNYGKYFSERGIGALHHRRVQFRQHSSFLFIRTCYRFLTRQIIHFPQERHHDLEKIDIQQIYYLDLCACGDAAGGFAPEFGRIAEQHHPHPRPGRLLGSRGAVFTFRGSGSDRLPRRVPAVTDGWSSPGPGGRRDPVFHLVEGIQHQRSSGQPGGRGGRVCGFSRRFSQKKEQIFADK